MMLLLSINDISVATIRVGPENSYPVVLSYLIANLLDYAM